MGPSPEERDAAFHKQVNERAKAVDKLLQQKQYEAALQESLTKPPIGCKVQSTKDKNLKTVLAVISSAPSDEAKIRAMIEKMHNSSGDLCTTLMKYIYRGLAEGQYSGKCGADGIRFERNNSIVSGSFNLF